MGKRPKKLKSTGYLKRLYTAYGLREAYPYESKDMQGYMLETSGEGTVCRSTRGQSGFSLWDNL